jgi:hypothetical protein
LDKSQACGHTFAVTSSWKLPADFADSAKETHFDARMDVDVYHDVVMGDSDGSNGWRRTERWSHFKPGVWISVGGFGSDIHAADPRVISSAGRPAIGIIHKGV